MQEEWKNEQVAAGSQAHNASNSRQQPLQWNRYFQIDHQVNGTSIFFPEMWSLLFYPELGGKPAVIEALEGLKKAEADAEEAKQVGQRFFEWCWYGWCVFMAILAGN